MIGQWYYYCIFFPFFVLWLPLFSFYCCCTRLERLVIAHKGRCGRLLKESVCTSTTSRQTEKGRSHIGSTVVCRRDPVCDGHFFLLHNIYYIYLYIRRCTSRISYWACKCKISNWWLRQYFWSRFAYWFVTIVFCSVPIFHQKACMAWVQSVQIMRFEYYFQTKWN